MNSNSQWYGNLNIPDALRLAHDEARAELVRATTEGGRIAEAAKRLAQLCLPHFEWEEKTVFPILGLLPELTRGDVRPGMVEVLPMIADFSARQDALGNQHQLILSAVETLLLAAHREKKREFAEFAYNLRVHERIEDEVTYPTVLLIGQYLRQSLSMH